MIGVSTVQTKIKLFQNDTDLVSQLETEVNKWLTSHHNKIEIVKMDVQTVPSGYDSKYNKGKVVVSICYRENAT